MRDIAVYNKILNYALLLDTINSLKDIGGIFLVYIRK